MTRRTAFRHPHTCPRCRAKPGEECRSASGRVANTHQVRVDLYLADVTGVIELNRRLPDAFIWQGLDLSRATDPDLYRTLEASLARAWVANDHDVR